MNIAGLVGQLEDPGAGPEVILQLASLGDQAVPELVRFLLARPSPYPQGRSLAAQVLGAIGTPAAIDALRQALPRLHGRTADPQLALADEAVREVIAAELGRVGDRRAIPELLDALRQTRLTSAAESLAVFGVPEAIPPTIELLRDPFRRQRAGDALIRFGPAAIQLLIRFLVERWPPGQEEPRWQSEARMRAARLLGEIGDQGAAEALRYCLKEEPRGLRIQASLALICLGCEADVLPSIPTLVAGLDATELMVAADCEKALEAVGDRALPVLVQAVAERTVDEGEFGLVPLTTRGLKRVIDALARMRTSEAVRALTPLAQGPPDEVRAWAVAALHRMSQPREP